MEDYQFIDTPEALRKFADQNQKIDWMCFDTEFVGEKRFYTLLCLIQIKTVHGNYVIDPIRLPDIDPILRMMEDPEIIKVTHAGENDYRLLNTQFDILPVNLFDTQIAAAFTGYKYPVSFQNLVSGELNLRLKKSHTVTDWESRPLSKQQISYALDDILPLYDLWKKLEAQLQRSGRLSWARDEMASLESPDFYAKDPYKEALQSRMMRKANRREKVFLLRIYNWRREVAAHKNYSKEMILSSKMIPHIVKGMRSGKGALKGNRRLPNKIVEQQWSTFKDFYEREITAEEKAALQRLKTPSSDDPKKDTIYEILYTFIKYKCLQENMAVNIAFPRAYLKQIKENPDFAEKVFGSGWRKEFLGSTFTHWLQDYDDLRIEIGEQSIQLRKDNG